MIAVTAAAFRGLAGLYRGAARALNAWQLSSAAVIWQHCTMHGWANHRVTLDDLIAFAWSSPMRDLADRIGFSDVGLKKVLTGYGVVCPPQGHWNRVHAGRKVPIPPNAPARRPGERPFLYVDRRFRVIPEAPLPSSSGPFQSSEVPESLAELQAKERRAIGRAATALSLGNRHREIEALLQHDEMERSRAAASRWPMQPKVLFDSPFEKRRLRILNAVVRTLAKRGHGFSSSIDEYYVSFSAVIGDTCVPVRLDELGRRSEASNRYTALKPDPKRTASCKLEFRAGEASWADDAAGALETKIGDICAGLIVEGEKAYREHLGRLEAEIKRQAIEDEKRRQERLKKAEQDRVAALLESGRLLAEATHLRSVIANVRSAVAKGTLAMSDAELEAWSEWAYGHADSIDPVRSGQVRAHLRPSEDL